MKTSYKPTALGWWVIVSVVALLIVALFASCAGTSVRPDGFWVGGWHGETAGNAHRTGGVQSGADYSGETNGVQAGLEFKFGSVTPPKCEHEDQWLDHLFAEQNKRAEPAPVPEVNWEALYKGRYGEAPVTPPAGPLEPPAPAAATEAPAKPHEEPKKPGEPVPWVLILTSTTTLASAVLMALQKMGKTELLSPKGHGG